MTCQTNLTMSSAERRCTADEREKAVGTASYSRPYGLIEQASLLNALRMVRMRNILGTDDRSRDALLRCRFRGSATAFTLDLETGSLVRWGWCCERQLARQLLGRDGAWEQTFYAFLVVDFRQHRRENYEY